MEECAENNHFFCKRNEKNRYLYLIKGKVSEWVPGDWDWEGKYRLGIFLNNVYL